MPEISIYQTESGAIEVRIDQDTVRLNQAQMVALLDHRPLRPDLPAPPAL